MRQKCRNNSPQWSLTSRHVSVLHCGHRASNSLGQNCICWGLSSESCWIYYLISMPLPAQMTELQCYPVIYSNPLVDIYFKLPFLCLYSCLGKHTNTPITLQTWTVSIKRLASKGFLCLGALGQRITYLDLWLQQGIPSPGAPGQRNPFGRGLRQGLLTEINNFTFGQGILSVGAPRQESLWGSSETRIPYWNGHFG